MGNSKVFGFMMCSQSAFVFLVVSLQSLKPCTLCSRKKGSSDISTIFISSIDCQGCFRDVNYGLLMDGWFRLGLYGLAPIIKHAFGPQINYKI